MSAPNLPRSPRPRDWRFDLIRVYACFFVVVAHTTGQFQIAPDHTALGAFGVAVHGVGHSAMPLFFLTAGYFAGLQIQSGADVPKFWRKRLKRVWVPTAFWSAVYLVLYLAERGASGQSVSATRVLYDWLWQGKPGAGYHLWFLYVLFTLELVGPYVMLAHRQRARVVNAALLTLCLVFGVYTVASVAQGCGNGRGRLLFSVLALGYLPWYCWGAPVGDKMSRLPASARRRLGRVALFIAGLGLGATVATTYLVSSEYARSDFLPPCLLLAFGAWGYTLTRRDAVSPGIGRALRYLSELTFGIYILHIAALALLSRLAPRTEETVLGALALTVVAFLSSAVLTAILKKTPFLRRML